MPWRDGSGNSGNALSAHIILIRQCPTTPPSLSLVSHLSILLVLFVVTSCCCCCCCRLPLNGICRLCVTHAGHYPSTAAFRFLWNLRLCFEFPATPPPQAAACLLPLPLLFFLVAFSQKLTCCLLDLKFFPLAFCFVLLRFGFTHTGTHTRTQAYVCFMANKILLAFFLPVVFCTLSNFDGFGSVFRRNLIYACKSSLRSLGKLKSSAREFVRMLIRVFGKPT